MCPKITRKYSQMKSKNTKHSVIAFLTFPPLLHVLPLSHRDVPRYINVSPRNSVTWFLLGQILPMFPRLSIILQQKLSHAHRERDQLRSGFRSPKIPSQYAFLIWTLWWPFPGVSNPGTWVRMKTETGQEVFRYRAVTGWRRRWGIERVNGRQGPTACGDNGRIK